MTNFEKIKALPAADLAQFLCGICADCLLAMLNLDEPTLPNETWLAQECD